MANFTMEQIKELKELGFSNEQIVALVGGAPNQPVTKKPTAEEEERMFFKKWKDVPFEDMPNEVKGRMYNLMADGFKPKKATESKAPRKVLTAEEREAKAKARTEAWKAEKKAWAEEHYTEAERKAFKEERDAKRAEGKKKHIAYCKTNAFFDGKKVSKEEWHKKYNEFLAVAN